MGCGPRQLISHWHQHTDVIEKIEPQNLEQAMELAGEMAIMIDTSAGNN